MKGEYISRTETAKIIKKLLQKEFPETKFSVKSESYSGGGAINISYENGPTEKEVESITRKFQSTGFDGMIDMSYSISHWVDKDNNIVGIKTHGTEGSRGVVPSKGLEKPENAVREVCFSSGYIFVNRHIGKDVYLKLSQFIFDNWSLPTEVKKPINEEDLNTSFRHDLGYDNWYRKCYKYLRDISLTNYTKDSEFECVFSEYNCLEGIKIKND